MGIMNITKISMNINRFVQKIPGREPEGIIVETIAIAEIIT
jgi:hypothetical protein